MEIIMKHGIVTSILSGRLESYNRYDFLDKLSKSKKNDCLE